MCYSNYLVTPKGYYFYITEQAMLEMEYEGLRILEKAGCTFCQDEMHMLEKHIEVMAERIKGYSVKAEDLICTYLVLDFGPNGYVYFGDRGGEYELSAEKKVYDVCEVARLLVEFEL